MLDWGDAAGRSEEDLKRNEVLRISKVRSQGEVGQGVGGTFREGQVPTQRELFFREFCVQISWKVTGPTSGAFKEEISMPFFHIFNKYLLGTRH